METHFNSARTLAIAAAGALFAIMMLGVPAGSDARSVKPRAASTVTISGKAYRFNHMDTPLPGATIKVREFPKLRAVTEPNGDYSLKVPNDRNVTPYILSGSIPPGTDPASEHYNELDLQTFHPRGRNIVNANFQVPTDFEYTALKGILAVPAGPDGRPEQCAIVTTASDRDVRGVDYQTFWDRTKTDANGVHGHGVPGATAIGVPSLGAPTYFNDNVIPDKTETSTSSDGGIIWEIVPAGTYRIITTHPTTRFASFLATCENGRIVNANPPWGAYELSPGEKPLAASNVAAYVSKAKATRKGKKARSVAVTVRSGEDISFAALMRKGGKVVATKTVEFIGTGTRTIRFRIKPKVKPGKANVKVILTDTSGVSFGANHRVKLPKVVKKKAKQKQKKR